MRSNGPLPQVLLFGLPNACASAAKRPAHLYCIERTPPQTVPVLSPFESEMDMQPNFKSHRPTVGVDGAENTISSDKHPSPKGNRPFMSSVQSLL